MIAEDPEYFLQIKGIGKEYPVPHLNPFKPSKKLSALKEIDLNIPKGSVSCILGPNGAGKTTLIKILADLILPDSGEITRNSESRLKVGLVTPNDRSFYWRLTGRHNLDFFASLYNIKNKSFRIQQVLEEVGLKADADRPFRQYSAGMKQKLNIARALLSHPSLYLLDEPAAHLDPLARENLWSFIDQVLLKKEGATVVLCTHDLEEAAVLADYIALLHEGRIIAQGYPSLLKQLVQKESRFQLVYSYLPQKWKKEHQALIHSEKDSELILQVEGEEISSLLEGFIKSGGIVKEIKKKEPLLMDIMKHFIGAYNG